MSIQSIGTSQFFTKKNVINTNKKVVSFSASDRPNTRQFNELRVFYHHIYEYKKGLRNLVLTTEKAANKEIKENIPYVINEVNGKNINVFFGNKDCIKVVSTFDSRLYKLTPEQDFMLGTMLGYDKIQQCQRYFDMKEKYIKNQRI